MPRSQKQTKCGICHEYKGVYTKIMFEGLEYWVCMECFDKIKEGD